MENKTPFMSEIPEKEPQRQQYFMAHAKEQLHILEENLGRPLTCCINTFGCQMNALAWSSDIQRSFLSGRGTRT